MKTSLIAVLLGLLTACASAPQPVTYYNLNDIQAPLPSPQPQSETSLLVLSRPQLAEYLRQSFLVIQTAPHQLHFARQHVWAENLASSIEQLLISRLNQHLTDTLVISAMDPRATKTHQRMEVKIDQLLPRHQGDVTLTAHYWLTGKDIPTQARRFYHQQPLNQDGYAHAVAQMHKAVAALAQDMANTLNARS